MLPHTTFKAVAFTTVDGKNKLIYDEMISELKWGQRLPLYTFHLSIQYCWRSLMTIFCVGFIFSRHDFRLYLHDDITFVLVKNGVAVRKRSHETVRGMT